jgi:hypothetical protein
VTGLRHRAAARALRLRDQANQQSPDRVICVAPRSWTSSSAEPKPPHQPQSRPTTPAHATHRSPATRPELAITSRQPITSSRSGKPLRNDPFAIQVRSPHNAEHRYICSSTAVFATVPRHSDHPFRRELFPRCGLSCRLGRPGPRCGAGEVTGAVERLPSGPASGVPGPAAVRACRDVPLARCGLCAGWGSRSRRTASPGRAKAAVHARDRAAMLASTWWRKAPEIARLAGHACTRTSEVTCRRRLPPVITTGAEIMTSSSQEPSFLVPARKPPRSGTSQPRISGCLARTHDPPARRAMAIQPA